MRISLHHHHHHRHLLFVDSPDAVGQAVVAPLWRNVAVDPLDLQEELRPACRVVAWCGAVWRVLLWCGVVWHGVACVVGANEKKPYKTYTTGASPASPMEIYETRPLTACGGGGSEETISGVSDRTFRSTGTRQVFEVQH